MANKGLKIAAGLGLLAFLFYPVPKSRENDNANNEYEGAFLNEIPATFVRNTEDYLAVGIDLDHPTYKEWKTDTPYEDAIKPDIVAVLDVRGISRAELGIGPEFKDAIEACKSGKHDFHIYETRSTYNRRQRDPMFNKKAELYFPSINQLTVLVDREQDLLDNQMYRSLLRQK